MAPLVRKLLYAVSFELCGILVASAGLVAMTGTQAGSSLILSTISAGVAMTWSMAFNAGFELWEARQKTRGRPFRRRALHALLFEATMTLIFVPFLAWWLGVTLWRAFTYELGLIGLFVVYTWAFTWAFDRIFGLPPSAR